MSGDQVPWEAVIGLEVHAQVSTASKMFCGCSAHYAGSPPNSRVCPVCLGLPGSLPVVNARAVRGALRTALALKCRVPKLSRFDRKNYSYPDLPKGYQISQFDMPLGLAGHLEFRVGAELRHCGITRVHLEEDTGKTFHKVIEGREVSLIDYNRSGVPLMEIVGEPHLRSGEAAREYFATLRQILMYLGVNDGNLQEGSMRADVNVSVRDVDGKLGTKVEIKNLNSFRAVRRSIDYELARQRALLADGETIWQETRGWSESDEITVGQRNKEYAHDYRYFPEPDLPPLHIAASLMREERSLLPELPLARSRRLVAQFGLPQDTADVLTLELDMADFFEDAVHSAGSLLAGQVANWLTGDVMRLLNESGVELGQSKLRAPELGKLVRLLHVGTISGAAGKTVLEGMFETGEEPGTIVERLELGQIKDEDTLISLVEQVIGSNPELVELYRRGKVNVLQALVGKTIQSSKGRATPIRVRQLLEDRLRAAD
jgi:aspartyl-tRNA(Asn)/glutamyl-tRNA(Gln) amidotransferase subunit B